MRKLVVLTLAIVLAVVAFVPSSFAVAKPVHADTATWCGNGVETIDVTYEDTALYKKQTALVLDSYPLGPPYHYVDTDLKAYHVALNGFCWKSYRVSGWLEDSTTANIVAWIRTWVCGRGPYQWNQQFAATNVDTVPNTGWGSEPTITRNVVMWDGSLRTMTFARYGNSDNGTLCGPQADNYGSQAWTDTWHDPPHLYADPSNPYWYVHI